MTGYVSESNATAPPKVYSPVRYWQNCSKPLTAIPSGGGTLNWYLTNLPAEIPTATAPTPITTSVGSTTTYYESPIDFYHIEILPTNEKLINSIRKGCCIL